MTPSCHFGIVVIDLDADPFLELVNDYTGLGRTGETNLATAVGDYGVYLTPLKFDRNAALKRKIEMHAPQLAMSRALDGQTGLEEEVQDYTGQAVIASTRYLPDTGWGIVTKIDREEALSGVHALQQLLLLISLAGIAAAVAASYLPGRWFGIFVASLCVLILAARFFTRSAESIGLALGMFLSSKWGGWPSAQTGHIRQNVALE